ncbi:hypothetical protein JYT96_01920 [Gammaproteobacteria bacterium AH-315-C21]|nr:hypothetical protein [Gammaproteobacteria bacterium AH-315-C21]
MSPKYIAITLALFITLSSCTKIIHKGSVIHIADGVTLTIRTEHKDLNIRLAEIDAPEYSQPYRKKPKKALAKLISSHNITAEEQPIAP